MDQVASRRSPDLVPEAVRSIERRRVSAVVLGPDRTAGDEFEVLVSDARVAIAIAFDLLRSAAWSVGLGVGAVDAPLPATANAATGDAMLAARNAIEAAKHSPSRFAVRGGEALLPDGPQLGALFDLVLDLRRRRSPEGWQVADLLEEHMTQTAVAARLGITPQAVSLRARAGGIRLEEAALPVLTALLARLDGTSVAGVGAPQ